MFECLASLSSLVTLVRATQQISTWAKDSAKAYSVFVRDVPSLMLTVRQPELFDLHQDVDLVVADGDFVGLGSSDEGAWERDWSRGRGRSYGCSL